MPINRLVVLAGTILALALPLLTGQPATASAAINWGSPTQLGPDLPSSWFPDIAADPSGTVRILWEGNIIKAGDNPRVDSAVLLSELGPQGWSPPADIRATDGSYAARSVIASDGRWVHVLYRKEAVAGQSVRLWYVRAPANADLSDAHVWSTPQSMSDDMSYYSQMVILPNGEIVCVFNQILPASVQTGARRTGLFVRRSSDDGKTWTSAMRISDSSEQVARSGVVLSPKQGTLIAFWDEGYENMSGMGAPKQIGTARSVDGGRTWTDRQIHVSPTGPIEQSFVTFAAEGPVLAYRTVLKDVIFFRSSADDGRTWSDEQLIDGAVARPYTGQHNFDRFSLAADSDGRVYLAYVGTDLGAPKGLAVMVATFAAGRWSQPIRVATPDGYPEYPRLAVALGNQLQLVYFVRDKLYDTGHYTLWAISGQSDAQPIARVTPLPVALSSPIAAPSPVAKHNIQPYPSLLAPERLEVAPGERFSTPFQVAIDPAHRVIRTTLLVLAILGPITLILRRVAASLS